MELVVVDTAAAAEALLFSRSAAIAASLWAWWLAAMAAAVGLWRFRSVAASKPASVVAAIPASLALPPSTKPDAAAGPDLHPPSPKPDAAAAVAAAAAARMESLALPPAQPSAKRFQLEEDCFSTPKGRFTAYFQADASEWEATGHDEDDAAEEKAVGEGFDWQEEDVVVAAATEVRSRSTGDLGWYWFQDRSALNGSVVRLWDGQWRLTAAPPTAAAAIRRRPAGKIAPVRGKLGMCI